MFKLMIIEGNRLFRETLGNILAAKFPKISTTNVEDGEKALQEVKRSPLDLIFLDDDIISLVDLMCRRED